MWNGLETTECKKELPFQVLNNPYSECDKQEKTKQNLMIWA